MTLETLDSTKLYCYLYMPWLTPKRQPYYWLIQLSGNELNRLEQRFDLPSLLSIWIFKVFAERHSVV